MLRRRERWRPRRPPGEPVLVLCPEGDHRDEIIACEKAKRSDPFPRFRKKGRSDELGEKVLSDSRCFFSSKCFFADATPGFFFPSLSQRIPLPLAAALGRLFFRSPGESMTEETRLGHFAVTEGVERALGGPLGRRRGFSFFWRASDELFARVLACALDSRFFQKQNTAGICYWSVNYCCGTREWKKCLQMRLAGETLGGR